jgi:hypothetical protein
VVQVAAARKVQRLAATSDLLRLARSRAIGWSNCAESEEAAAVGATLFAAV